jgi:nickel-dependent lactate racemase
MTELTTLTLESLGKAYTLDVPKKNLMIYHEPQAAALPDPKGSIVAALEVPTGAPRLVDAAQGAKNATVIVDDWGRSEATRREVAPIVLDHLNRAGIPDEQITVVIARGLGLAPSMAFVEQTFGLALMARPIRHHISAVHRSGQRFLGFSTLGSPVWIDRAVTDSDFVVGIGSAFPSPWGGWSGGAKIIVPGVASSDTICHNHAMMLHVTPGAWDHPGLADREEIARMAGLDFLVNLVLSPGGEIAAVGAGEFRQTHRRMGDEFLKLYSVGLPAKPEVVVTTVGWWQGPTFPMDSLYGFVDQSLPCLERIAAPGSTIVLVGNAPGGIWAGMREYMRTAYTLEDLAELKLRAGTLAFVAVLLGIQVKMRQARYRMILAVDGIDAGTLADMGFEPAPSANQALQMALSRYGPEAQVAVLPALGCPNWPVIG